MKTWLITGGSRGFGRAFAEAALERGDRVAATSRNADGLADLIERFGDAFLPLELDLNDSASIGTVFAEAAERFGRIDVVVNNAGFILVGALEEMTEEDAREQFEILFFGPYLLTRSAVAHMREHGGGTIVQVSSLAGVAGLPGHSFYAAAKWALEGMTEATQKEVADFGIRMILLEPGGFRTDIATGVRQSSPLPAYEEILQPQRERYRNGSFATAEGDPARAAEAVLDLVDRPDPPKRLLMGNNAYDVATRTWRERLAAAEAWEPVTRSLSFEEAT